MNLAATVNVVLYDRLAKSLGEIDDQAHVIANRDNKNRLKVKAKPRSFFTLAIEKMLYASPSRGDGSGYFTPTSLQRQLCRDCYICLSKKRITV